MKKAIIFQITLLFAGSTLGQSLKGKITLSAPPQPLAAHQVTKHQTVCGPQIPNEALLWGKKLELANVVVLVANLKPESDLRPAVIPFDLQDCRYQPHVLAMLPGDTLLLRNHDDVLHDARGELHPFHAGWNRQVTKDLFQATTQTVFDFALPRASATAFAVVQQPGLLRVFSRSGHPWMQAYVLVAPHRAFAVTNEKGEFTLPRLPSGQYDLILWHEYLGVKRQLVEIAAGKPTELVLTWELEANQRAVSPEAKMEKAATEAAAIK